MNFSKALVVGPHADDAEILIGWMAAESGEDFRSAEGFKAILFPRRSRRPSEARKIAQSSGPRLEEDRCKPRI